MTQHITKPTHREENTLDLVLKNNSYLLHSYEIIKLLQSVSDHYVVECCTQYNSIDKLPRDEEKPDLASPFDKLNFHSDEVNWDEVTKKLLETINWADEISSCQPEEMADKFLQPLLTACSGFVPEKRTASTLATTKIPRDRRNHV